MRTNTIPITKVCPNCEQEFQSTLRAVYVEVCKDCAISSKSRYTPGMIEEPINVTEELFKDLDAMGII